MAMAYAIGGTLETMSVANLESYLGSVLMVRACIEWLKDGTERVIIVIFDKYEHDEGWEVSGRVQYFWEDGYLCYAGLREIPNFPNDQRHEVITTMIRELGWVCPSWAEGHPWVTRELPNEEKLDPASFSLLRHYCHLEALLYVMAQDPSYTFHQRNLLWSMIHRFGGFNRRMRKEWTKKMK